MANQIILFRALDSNGYVISGAKAYVYLTGTFTIIPVYSDEAGTIPASNPVIANANGFFPQRFITQAARVAFKLADETTLYTLDPAPITASSGSGAGQVSFTPTVNIPQVTVQTAVEAVDTNSRARDIANLAASQPLDADLTAIAAIGTTGLVNRTGAGTAATVANGTGDQQLRMVAGVPIWTTVLYESAEQTITAAGSLTLTHGLGIKPKYVFCEAICKTAEYGYAVGDVVPMSVAVELNSATEYGFSLRLTTTTILLRYAGAGLAAINLSSGVGVALTNANWRLIVRATI